MNPSYLSPEPNTGGVEESETGDAAAQWRHVDPPALSAILSAALDAFSENGFHGASVRDICHRVGVTLPTLYYHHKNKEGLLLDLLEYSTGDVVARAQAASAAGGENCVLQLANVIEAIVLPMTIRSRLAAVEGEVRYLSPENRSRYRVVRRGVEDIVLRIVEDGQERGVFRVIDPRETTRAMLAMCQAIPRWYDAAGPMTPETVAQKYVEIALTMVGCVNEARDTNRAEKIAPNVH